MTNDLQQAIAAIKAGDKEAGQQLLAQVIKAEPKNEAAWLWMASTLDDPQEKKECLQKVLQINPDNETARQALAQLEPPTERTNPMDEQVNGTTQSFDPVINKFLNEKQDPEVVKIVFDRVSQILTSQEEIRYIAVQNPPLSATPDCVVLTNRRFILHRPKLLGGVHFQDHIWRDLQDVHLKEGMRSATLTWRVVGKPVQFSIGHVPKEQARRLYGFAQEMEEAAREERRLRDIEEKRAAAGGVVFQGNLPAQQPQPQSSAEDPVETLRKLKAMLEAELVTQDEYDAKKSEILSKM